MDRVIAALVLAETGSWEGNMGEGAGEQLPGAHQWAMPCKWCWAKGFAGVPCGADGR
jgi:hypothetical protein